MGTGNEGAVRAMGGRRASRRQFLGLSAGVGLIGGLVATGAAGSAFAATGTFDAKSYGGAIGNGTADDTAAIQKALNAAVNGGTATIPAGTYRVTGPLQIGSGTTLQMTAQTIILRDFVGGDTSGATICNSTQSGAGNSNIVIRGGVLQSRSATAVGKHLGFRQVNGLLVDGTHFTTVYGDWNTAFMGVNNLTLTNIVISSGTGVYEDGLHIGGGSGITISNCVISCGDDAISLTQEYGDLPDIDTVTIQNCVVSSVMANGVRILSTTSKQVRNVVITGLSGKVVGSHGISIEDPSAGGLVHDITVNGANLDLSANTATGINVFGATGIHLSRMSLGRTAGRPFHIERSTNVFLSQCQGTPIAPGLQSLLALNCTNVNLDQVISQNATQHAIVFSNVVGGTIHAASTSGAADTGIQLNSTTGVLVSDSVCSANVWGIRVDGSSAGNTITHNDFTGNRSGASATPSVGGTWSNNAGIDVSSVGRLPTGGYGSAVEGNPIVTPPTTSTSTVKTASTSPSATVTPTPAAKTLGRFAPIRGRN